MDNSTKANHIPQPLEDVRLTFTGERVARDIAKQLNQVVYATILSHLSKNAVITLRDLEEAGMPNISLRLDTVQAFFDGWRNELFGFVDEIFNAADSVVWHSEYDKAEFLAKITNFDLENLKLSDVKKALLEISNTRYSLIAEGVHRNGLHEMGAKIGWSFSVNLIQYARQTRNEIPLTYNKLLAFWSAFDSATDLANDIEANFSDPQDSTVEIVVLNSFLVRNRPRNQHIHCSFFEGYILGVLDGLFINWFNWINSVPYRTPSRYLRVTRVKETDGTETRCYFKADLYDEVSENIQFSTSKLAQSVLSLETGRTHEAMLEAKNSLETILSGAMGLEDSTPINFVSFLDQAERNGIKLSYAKFLSVYDDLNAIIHTKENVTKSVANGIIANIWLLIREIPKEFSDEEKRKMNANKKWLA